MDSTQLGGKSALALAIAHARRLVATPHASAAQLAHDKAHRAWVVAPSSVQPLIVSAVVALDACLLRRDDAQAVVARDKLGAALDEWHRVCDQGEVRT